MKGRDITHNFESGSTKDHFSSYLRAEDFNMHNMHNRYKKITEQLGRYVEILNGIFDILK